MSQGPDDKRIDPPASAPAGPVTLGIAFDRAGWERVSALAEVGVQTASLLHEIRTPLFAVLGRLQLAHARGGSIERSELGALIEMLGDVRDLVDHASGGLRTDEPASRFDLNAPLRLALDQLDHRSRQLDVAIDTSLHREALWVHGRPSAARQVAVNLLANAFDAVEAVRPRRIWVRTEPRGDRIRLVVQDNGPGVATDVRERLFEPFVTTKAVGRGTGLGLYITRKLVEEAKGDLTIWAPAEGGTRVEIDLPAATPR